MSIKKSIIEELTIESNDQKRSVDITSGAIAIEYYEDIFSPTITAKIKVVNTGNSISPPNSQGEPDGKKKSIYNGLPLRGGERVSLKISGNSDKNPGLDFSKNQDDYFYVSSITDVISDNQRESFTLHLTSREAITNETTRVAKKYQKATIKDSVKLILSDVLKTKKIGTLDDTLNSYAFIGNLRKPFTVLVWLASKAVPSSSGNATAGFVFFQTKDGFQFRSIDNLILQKPKKTYIYSESQQSYDDDNNKTSNDSAILNYTTDKNQNLIEKLRLGTYSSYRMFYNPLTFEFTPPEKGVFKLSDYSTKSKNLGQDIVLPKITNSSNMGLGDIPSRIITQCLDIGTMEKDVSTDQNYDPFAYQSQTLMRYNVLFTQNLSMVIPSDTNLRAGDIIQCQFPSTSSASNEFDKEQSGLYMIKELCHHFDTERSYTSLKLVRDTFGQSSEVRMDDKK
jgi:hypothetical protein